MTAGSGKRAGLEHLPFVLRAALLLGLSAIFTALFEALQLPAGLLLGPMAGAILMALGQAHLTMPALGFRAAQGMIGVMIASVLPVGLGEEIARDWPILITGALWTLCAAGLLGFLLARRGLLPGTTAIWGSLPGAASVMVVMSGAFRADMQLVAFMQYLRVVIVTVAATVIASTLGAEGGEVVRPAWLGTGQEWADLWKPAALAIAGVTIGLKFRVPAGPLVLPLIGGMVLRLGFGVEFGWPMPVLMVSYALLGWGIGLRFTPDVVRHAARAFPRVLASILLLVAICGIFAAVMVIFFDIDPLTAYLATSPGGADSIAIIAASTPVNVPLVITMQFLRFFLILFFGPVLAKTLSRLAHR